MQTNYQKTANKITKPVVMARDGEIGEEEIDWASWGFTEEVEVTIQPLDSARQTVRMIRLI